MIRISTIFLCLLLAAAAAGRYRAEVSVREMRTELRQIETSKLEELRTIKILRAEVAYLENPQRLAKIAAAKTDLRLPQRAQTLNAQQFAAALSGADVELILNAPPASLDISSNALAMAQLADHE